MVISVLDAMIEAAQAVDSKLHSALDYLIQLREKLSTFGADPDAVETDELVNELRALSSGEAGE